MTKPDGEAAMRLMGITIALAALAMALVQCTSHKGDAVVVRENARVYIVDRTGERWDVSEAEIAGFNAEGFQYGLGRDALTPLDSGALTNAASGPEPFVRVIGMASGDEASAFSVATLREHEVLNATLAGKPVAVGY